MRAELDYVKQGAREGDACGGQTRREAAEAEAIEAARAARMDIATVSGMNALSATIASASSEALAIDGIKQVVLRGGHTPIRERSITTASASNST